jgi:flagellar hook-associated protein 1
MSINFSHFEIGRRALNASQMGINLAGQNIANVNTPGYSRRQMQIAETVSLSPQGLSIGTGVRIVGTTAFRDNFVQARIQTETGIAGRLAARRDALAPVETALQGSETGGLQNALSSFFGGFRDLEANPTSVPLRALVVQKGAALASAFQTTNNRLEALRNSTDAQLYTAVDRVNNLTQKVADLNAQISTAEGIGSDASAMRDQRTELVTEIAGLTGARAVENTDGMVTLTIGEGRPLVSGTRAFSLEANNTPPFGLATITLEGDPAIFEEGTIAGLKDAVTEITKQIADLDGLAGAVVQRVNGLHTSGTDLDGAAGLNFFNDTPPVTAANISINSVVAANPRNVVASPLTQPGQNGTVAGEIAALLTDPNTTAGTRTGSFSSIFGSMLVDVGEQISSADNGLQTQAAIIAQATAQRDAVSGVSLDEEAINLLRYQKAFEAATRFIKIADEMTQMILSLGE